MRPGVGVATLAAVLSARVTMGVVTGGRDGGGTDEGAMAGGGPEAVGLGDRNRNTATPAHATGRLSHQSRDPRPLRVGGGGAGARRIASVGAGRCSTLLARASCSASVRARAVA